MCGVVEEREDVIAASMKGVAQDAEFVGAGGNSGRDGVDEQWVAERRAGHGFHEVGWSDGSCGVMTRVLVWQMGAEPMDGIIAHRRG